MSVGLQQQMDAPRWVRPSELAASPQRQEEARAMDRYVSGDEVFTAGRRGHRPGDHRQDDGTTAVVLKRKKTSQNVSNAASLETFRTPRRPDENSGGTDPGSAGCSIRSYRHTSPGCGPSPPRPEPDLETPSPENSRSLQRRREQSVRHEALKTERTETGCC